MTNRPDGVDLLETAREALLNELLPGLPEDKRLTALMIANAMGIAGRESAAGADPLRAKLRALSEIYPIASGEHRQGSDLVDELRQLERRLALDIRRGAFDAAPGERERVHALLLASAKRQTRINNPKYLDP